jgi:hypothetical protein
MHLKGPKAFHELKGEFTSTLKFQGDTDMSNDPQAYFSKGTFYYKSIDGFKKEKDEQFTKVYHDGERLYIGNEEDWRTIMDTSDNPTRGIFPHPAYPLHKLDDLSGQLAAWKKAKRSK